MQAITNMRLSRGGGHSEKPLFAKNLLIPPERLLHDLLFQPNAVEQGDQMQHEQRCKHDPALRNDREAKHLRDDVQVIIGVLDAPEQRGFNQLMALGNIDFEGPKASERSPEGVDAVSRLVAAYTALINPHTVVFCHDEVSVLLLNEIQVQSSWDFI